MYFITITTVQIALWPPGFYMPTNYNKLWLSLCWHIVSDNIHLSRILYGLAVTYQRTRTRRVHTSANAEVFSTSQYKVNGTIRIIHEFLYPDYEVNEAENRKGFKLHRSPYCWIEFFQNNGMSSISVILLTNGRKDGQTDKRSQF